MFFMNDSPPNRAAAPALPAAAPSPSAAPSEADALLDALGKLRLGRGGRLHGHRPPGSERRDTESSDTERRAHARPGDDGTDRAEAGPRTERGRRHGGPALLRLLSTLAHSPDPLSVSELADRVGVDQPRASRLVQQAVGAGHVEREADPTDARRSRARLTAAGAEFVHGARDRQRAQADSALSALAPAERSELVRLLGKLADAWPATPGTP